MVLIILSSRTLRNLKTKCTYKLLYTTCLITAELGPNILILLGATQNEFWVELDLKYGANSKYGH